MLDEASRRVATHADRLTHTISGTSGPHARIRRALRHHRLAPSIAARAQTAVLSRRIRRYRRTDASEIAATRSKASFTSTRARASAFVGGRIPFDYATYSQDDASKAQMDIEPLDDLRDFRLLFKGKLPIPGVTYMLGYMYDKVKEDWRFRQTGIMVELRKAHGNLFVGRTKEGFSTSKIIVGYQGRTASAPPSTTLSFRSWQTASSGPRHHERQARARPRILLERANTERVFSSTALASGTRLWLPLAGTDKGVLHIALQARHALSTDGELHYRSKPESDQSQAYAIDTGKFAADSANAYGFETYYRPGRSWSARSISSPELTRRTRATRSFTEAKSSWPIFLPARPGRTTRKAPFSIEFHRHVQFSMAGQEPGKSSSLVLQRPE